MFYNGSWLPAVGTWDPSENIALFGELCKESVYFRIPQIFRRRGVGQEGNFRWQKSPVTDRQTSSCPASTVCLVRVLQRNRETANRTCVYLSLAMYACFQLLSCVRLFAAPWTSAHQAALSFTILWSLCKFMCIESVMLSNYLIHCCPLLFLPSIFPSFRVFSSESALLVI